MSNSFTNSVGVFAETYRYLRLANSPEASIEKLKMQWAQSILSRLRVDLEITGSISNQKSILFVGNHLSYLDIPLLMSSVDNCSFVAKQELKSWPIFGTAAKKVKTVFVKRENCDSRKSARASIHEALDNGQRIVVFPSGTTCLSESKSWKRGAFEIACERDIQIQPFRISYSPLREVAYIDKDFFPFHLYSLSGLDHIKAKIEFHTPVKVDEPSWDCLNWHYWSRGLVSEKMNTVLTPNISKSLLSS